MENIEDRKLKLFEFENGRKIAIRRVSPFLAFEVRKSMQKNKPKPPTQKVMIGDVETIEANLSHPDYLEALQDYETEVQNKSTEFMINRGVVITLSDEEKQEIKELREEMESEYGVTLSGSDKLVFVLHILISGTEEIGRLINAISGLGQPTAEAIGQAKEMFPGDLQGS